MSSESNTKAKIRQTAGRMILRLCRNSHIDPDAYKGPKQKISQRNNSFKNRQKFDIKANEVIVPTVKSNTTNNSVKIEQEFIKKADEVIDTPSALPPVNNGSKIDLRRSVTERRRSSARRSNVRLRSTDMDKLVTSKTQVINRKIEKGGSFANRMGGVFSRVDAVKISRQMSEDFMNLLKIERQRDWMNSFCHLDPRSQILRFFNDVAREGAYRIEETDCTIQEQANCPPIIRMFSKASVFSVWRPTSMDAIRKMMNGEGIGKGLDVKGKSAKKGILSGFVPFLQIYEEKHKSVIRWPPKDASIRLFFKSESARDKAALKLTSVSDEMVAIVSKAREIITNHCDDDEAFQAALEDLVFEVTDPTIELLDEYAPLRFGIVVAERIFFKAYISMQDISRSPEYETGRASDPDFQDMNSLCVRKYKGIGPRAVVLQHSESVDDALNPQSLILAYEEHGRVLPVVSDFDCFLVGTRNVYYSTPLSKDQKNLMEWLLTQIESILDSPLTSKSWTGRWLEVLKTSADNGFVPKMPQFGFADAKSYAIMECAVGRLKDSGAVRHNAESSNYFFPQELDDHFLVISDSLKGNVPWKYVNVEELQKLMCERIDEGYTFPLNPKWILADKGWKAVYDKMMASDDESIQQSMNVWYPRGGIRERMEDIYRRFPAGFQRSNTENGNKYTKAEGTEAMDLAQQSLRRHLLFRGAVFKIRCSLTLSKALRS